MNQNFVLEHGVYGPRLVATGPWSPAIASYMHREEVTELYLNHARGWRGRSVEFLKELPNLVGFGILDFTIEDVSPVHCLTNLRTLELSTYCKTPVEFGCFPTLEDCVFYWRPGSESLFSHRTLRRLFLHRYEGEQSAPFAQLTNLRALSLANGELTELIGLGYLRALRFLGLFNLKRVTSLSGIEFLSELETLEVNGCRSISAVGEIASLIRLRRLLLIDCGKIASLKPIQDARELQEVLFYGSTYIVDGDLSPLAALPCLKTVSFQNRRHYSHRRGDFTTTV